MRFYSQHHWFGVYEYMLEIKSIPVESKNKKCNENSIEMTRSKSPDGKNKQTLEKEKVVEEKKWENKEKQK